MKLSSDMVTDTFAPSMVVSLWAYARDRASLTLRPNGKWNTSFWLPEGSMYSSTASILSSGMKPATASCSLKYENMLLAEPSSTSNSLDISEIAFLSSWRILSAISLLNTATSMERSKDLGNISPAQEGTVGFLPFASLTYAVIPLERTNSKDLPPRTKTSLGDSLSTNFSDSSPATVPWLLMTR